ncbi:hypothetical protein ECP03047993_5353 [Escherichia coli P0304799.3]|nr:hypothetical protein ECP03047993_5353 [Escherichia coli P0304799.3]
MQFLATCPTSVGVMEACMGAHFMARRIVTNGAKVALPQPG